jgi:hypothetical protein
MPTPEVQLSTLVGPSWGVRTPPRLAGYLALLVHAYFISLCPFIFRTLCVLQRGLGQLALVTIVKFLGVSVVAVLSSVCKMWTIDLRPSLGAHGSGVHRACRLCQAKSFGSHHDYATCLRRRNPRLGRYPLCRPFRWAAVPWVGERQRPTTSILLRRSVCVPLTEYFQVLSRDSVTVPATPADIINSLQQVERVCPLHLLFVVPVVMLPVAGGHCCGTSRSDSDTAQATIVRCLSTLFSSVGRLPLRAPSRWPFLACTRC